MLLSERSRRSNLRYVQDIVLTILYINTLGVIEVRFVRYSYCSNKNGAYVHSQKVWTVRLVFNTY
jgi:hypothetical protein